MTQPSQHEAPQDRELTTDERLLKEPAAPTGSTTAANVGEMERMLDVATDVARRAGALIAGRHRASTIQAAETKGHVHNLVTETDRLSEALILATLATAFPDHAVRSEEGGMRTAAPGAIRWFVDPLDGTNNFAHAYPVFSVTLAAVLGDEALIAVTYDPIRDEMFSAIRGHEPTLNGQPMRVTPRATLDTCLVATGFPYDKADNPDNNTTELASILPGVRGLRRSGSAALDLCWVAAGRLDAYWEQGLQPWDLSAGLLLVSAAGGRVTDYAGRAAVPESGCVVASNGMVHDDLLERVRTARMAAGLPADGRPTATPTSTDSEVSPPEKAPEDGE